MSESRDVADTGHRTLENRITRAVIDGQRRAFGERAGGTGACEAVGDGSLERLDDSAGCDKLSRQSLGERDVLADRGALARTPADKALNCFGPGGCTLSRGSLQARERVRTQRGEDAQARP